MFSYLKPKYVHVVQKANNLSPTSQQCKISDPYIGNHCTTIRRLLIRFPMGSLGFFMGLILPVALRSWGSIQPLIDMNTMDITWD